MQKTKLEHMDEALQAKGSSTEEIKRTHYPRRSIKNASQETERFLCYVSLLNLRNITSRIDRLLTSHNIMTSF